MSSDLLFFSDPFFTGSPIQENSYNSHDPFFSSFFNFSPSMTHFEAQVQPTQNDPNLKSEFRDLSALDYECEVKSEEYQMGVDYAYNQSIPHSYSYSSGAESESKFIQRSFSCNSFDGKSGFIFDSQSQSDILMDSQNFQLQHLSSPEKQFLRWSNEEEGVQHRNLQIMKATHSSRTESTLSKEGNSKVGRYSAEERKEKISKYRAKRSQRKFNKTIKYACRKTLADNRTRIRGRFARNDEIPEAPCLTREEEGGEEEFWVEFIGGLT